MNSDHSVLQTPSGKNVEVAGERLLSGSGIRSDSVVCDEESRGANLNACTRGGPWCMLCSFCISVSMAMGMPSCVLAVSEQAAGVLRSRWSRRTWPWLMVL